MGCCATKTRDEIHSEGGGNRCDFTSPSSKDKVVHFNTPLNQINPDDIPILPHKGVMIDARIVDVLDGDTFVVIYAYGKEFLKSKIRLEGIDTPELHIKGERRLLPIGDLEKEAAEHVKKYLESEILGKILKLRISKFDKYGGRFIGMIFDENEISLTDDLAQKGYGRVYNGEKKEDWSREELEYILEN